MKQQEKKHKVGIIDRGPGSRGARPCFKPLLLLFIATSCLLILPAEALPSKSPTTTTNNNNNNNNNNYNNQSAALPPKVNIYPTTTTITIKETIKNSTATQEDCEKREKLSPVEYGFKNLTTNDSCSTKEYSLILRKIVENDDILKRFKEIEAIQSSGSNSNVSLSISFDATTNIRGSCVRELFRLIRGLASNELELKTMLEFATDTPSTFGANSAAKLTLASLKPSSFQVPNLQQNSYIQAKNEDSTNNLDSLSSASKLKKLLSFGRTSNPPVLGTNRLVPSAECGGEKVATSPEVNSFATAGSNEVAIDPMTSSSKLAKALANVDNWINGLEKFTSTRQWSSILRIFRGSETILSMFVTSKTNASSSANKIKEKTNNKTTTTTTTFQIEQLQRELPEQVMTLTDSLNSLFPWHVWPWNNLDLYSTIDTFLNHGIFAFSKTTIGPERRIDQLSEMLQTLFKSLKYDSFPKKCHDWSRIICDREAFFDKLVLEANNDEDSSVIEVKAIKKARDSNIKELAGNSRNQLTQELSCIMFSSLSMQHFGAKEDLEAISRERQELLSTTSQNNGRLPWDKQVSKAIRLFLLSREALNDEQRISLYNLINGLWSQQKVSQRVIMVGRVIQLITNCHMPREMLESALWKDIYKYKNVLNQLVDVITDELSQSSESGKLSVEQISLGSKGMKEIIEKFLIILPKLLESLSQTIVDELPDLVNRFFTEKQAFFRVPCKGYSFSDIIQSLAKHSSQIIELEELICRQFKTKPKIISMSQINNLMGGNDFFAMALNFTNYHNIQKMLTIDDQRVNQENLLNSQRHESIITQTSTPISTIKVKRSNIQTELNSTLIEQATVNVSSIIDEMAANPRLAQIVAILQSSALDPPEVHAELPELNWVEAGTSVALLYEAIQKLLSYEQVFVTFPEVANFKESLAHSLESSQQMFVKFSKRDPLRLLAYSLDTVMPIALRTYKPMESLHLECSSSLPLDIFGGSQSTGDELSDQSNQALNINNSNNKNSRQWQCFISSFNFASWATNNFLKTFNSMFKNVLAYKQTLSGVSRIKTKTILENPKIRLNSNTSCIFLDGSVSAMLDNLPQFIDLSLETVLMASTSLDQQLSLYDIICSPSYMLDPFNERSLEMKVQMKDKMCHLFNKKSFENCGQLLELQQWTSIMRELNSTWFEASSLSITPSFREITVNVHELLELFGQFKPSTMSDSLLARLLNVNSFWSKLFNKTMTIVDKYQKKRFEYALQTLSPIIYDNLPQSSSINITSNSTDLSIEIEDSKTRETLISTILAANMVLSYFERQPSNKSEQENFDRMLESLISWTEENSKQTAELLLRSLANNITKLELIFKSENQSSWSTINLSNGQRIWDRFCKEEISHFFDVSSEEINSTSIELAKDELCKLNWTEFYNELQVGDKKLLNQYPSRQLIRIALTKWGQLLDSMFIESEGNKVKQLPKFFYMQYWDQFRLKVPQISPLKERPSDLSWIWNGIERLIRAMDETSGQKNHQALVRTLDQLNCGLEAVKGGLSWENIANIYSDKQDILAAHSTIQNGFALASLGLQTFITHKKFQKLLDEFVKPRVGLNAFCEFRDRKQLEAIFLLDTVSSNNNNQVEFMEALESFQELICDTNFETLAQNINPISVCYQVSSNNQTTISEETSLWPLAENMDRFFKLASLAVFDAKLVASSDAKPPILDKNEWSSFWSWWWGDGGANSDGLQSTSSHNSTASKNELSRRKKSGIALALVRAFQTIDSINSEHVVWKALFKSVHEISEVSAYLLRAVERQQEALSSTANFVRETADKLDSAIKSSSSQQQLASTLSNIMFPEVNNFISFKTFKQLRFIKIIWEYFTQTPGASDLICNGAANFSKPSSNSSSNQNSDENDKQQLIELATSRLELINYKISSNERLFALLCHYEPSQWLTALNIVISSRTSSIPKKVNYITRYLSILVRHYKLKQQLPILESNKQSNSSNELLNSLESFVHSQELETIEFVANRSVSYLLASSQSIKSLSFSKIGNISWHSLPNILDSIDKHLCASRYELGTFKEAHYEPKKIDMETLVCKLPQWNGTQVYNYVNENFDLQNMISLISSASLSGSLQQQQQQQQQQSKINTQSNSTTTINPNNNNDKICITPFKFASKWLKIIQETLDDFMSRSSKEKIKKCLNQSRKGKSFYRELLNYIKHLNNLLSSLDQLSSSQSWPRVKKSWSTISHMILNHNQVSSAEGPIH